MNMRRFRPMTKPVFLRDKAFYWLKHHKRNGTYCLWLGTYWRYLYSLWGYVEVMTDGGFRVYITGDVNSCVNKADMDPFRYGPVCTPIGDKADLDKAMNLLEDRITNYLERVDKFYEDESKTDNTFETILRERETNNAKRSD